KLLGPGKVELCDVDECERLARRIELATRLIDEKHIAVPVRLVAPEGLHEGAGIVQVVRGDDRADDRPGASLTGVAHLAFLCGERSQEGCAPHPPRAPENQDCFGSWQHPQRPRVLASPRAADRAAAPRGVSESPKVRPTSASLVSLPGPSRLST